jgi:hypothetical protein
MGNKLIALRHKQCTCSTKGRLRGRSWLQQEAANMRLNSGQGLYSGLRPSRARSSFDTLEHAEPLVVGVEWAQTHGGWGPAFHGSLARRRRGWDDSFRGLLHSGHCHNLASSGALYLPQLVQTNRRLLRTSLLTSSVPSAPWTGGLRCHAGHFSPTM